MPPVKDETDTNAKGRRKSRRAAKAVKAAAEAAADKSTASEASIDVDEYVLDTIDDPEKFGKLVPKKTAKQISETEGCKWYRFFDPQTGEQFPKETVQVISKKPEPPEPQNEFAEYPDGVVPGFWIPLMFMLGFLAVVTKKEKMSVSNFIDQITEMVGYPVQVYSIGGKRYIIVFQSLQDVFDAVNTSYRTQQHSKIKIRKYQSDQFREDTRCFPLFHPEDPIFQKNRRKMKPIPEQVEASSNAFAPLPF